MRHHYRTYGLVLDSEVPLEELDSCAPTTPDIYISRRPIPSRQSTPTSELFLEIHGGEAYFEYAYIGRILIADSATIYVDPNPGLPTGLINMALLGPVLAILLHLRGFLVLHGSAIGIGGGGDIFLGDKGAGKSTLAGALLAAGHPLIADDLAAISFTDKAAFVTPGYPQIKLSFEATKAFSIADTEIIPTPIDDFPKNRLRISAPFNHNAQPIGACYILERGKTASIEKLSGVAAVSAILRYSYSVRFGKTLLTATAAAEHMKQCARLVNEVPVRRLTVPHGIINLPAISELLLSFSVN